MDAAQFNRLLAGNSLTLADLLMGLIEYCDHNAIDLDAELDVARDDLRDHVREA